MKTVGGGRREEGRVLSKRRNKSEREGMNNVNRRPRYYIEIN
jgi:hypothetical protein